VVNDISAELAGNALSAEEAAELVEEASADLR
jgi:raffinose/stachyose/melibiose transport system substrate-binding protein